MDVHDALRSRRMVRSFDASPLEPEEVVELFEASLWAPTAGNARGVSWVVLVGPDEVARYFDAATDADWRRRSARASGLGRASAIGVCIADPVAYIARYAKPDKVTSGLGESATAWPVPYWIGDAGAATMAALLLAQERGIAAAFLGAFRNDEALKLALAIPTDHLIYGAVLLGRPDNADHRSASLGLDGISRSDRIHRGSLSGSSVNRGPGL